MRSSQCINYLSYWHGICQSQYDSLVQWTINVGISIDLRVNDKKSISHYNIVYQNVWKTWILCEIYPAYFIYIYSILHSRLFNMLKRHIFSIFVAVIIFWRDYGILRIFFWPQHLVKCLTARFFIKLYKSKY